MRQNRANLSRDMAIFRFFFVISNANGYARRPLNGESYERNSKSPQQRAVNGLYHCTKFG